MTGVELDIETGDIYTLITALRRIPEEFHKELSPVIRGAAAPILADARARASWSSRIPGAISVRPSLGGRRVGVKLTVSARKAPHARPYEGIEGNASFRHPLFGDRENWYEQGTRPFLAPAVQAGGGAVIAAISRAVDDAAHKHGFR